MKRVLVATVAVAVIGMPGRADLADAAPVVHDVQIGAVNEDNPLAPYVYTRYYPSELRVHRGDTVRWTLAVGAEPDLAFHTVTFLGNNSVTRPHALRADELPGSAVFSERIWDRSGPCGGDEGEPCVLSDIRQPVSSGLLFLVARPMEFRVRVDLPVGRYTYVCTMHPHMAGSVNVVPARTSLRNPTEVQIEQEIAKDTVTADKLMAKYSKPTATTEDGQRVWTVVMQPRSADKHVSVLGYLPTALRVRAGDRVRWLAYDEPHTVTFPGETAFPIGLTGTPRCDVDDPQSGAVGFPYASLDCPVGAAELSLPDALARPTRAAGDAVMTQATVHHSGTVVERNGAAYWATHPDGTPLPTEFDAVFPRAGTFEYACVVHAAMPMEAAITVE